MRKILFGIFIILILFACKKDELDGGYSILQGKWKWIGASETVTNHNTGNQTSSWVSFDEYSNEYFMEFEKKGKLSYWINESESRFYRIETVTDDPDCDLNFVNNCHYVGINLNFNVGDFLHIFTNEDTMVVISSLTHVPAQNYSDQTDSYSYIHRFVRIN